MIPFHRVERSIPDLIFLVVITTTISSFALSFVNLQAAAIESGINTWLSFLWPVCIDAVLIAGSLMILRSSLRNESPVVGWLVLLGFTIVSTGFNILHSPEEITSRLAHAVPPISLCVSIEILMLIIRSDLKRTAPAPVHDPVTDPSPVQVSSPEPIPTVQQEEDEPCTPIGVQVVSDDEIIEVFNASPGISYTQAAVILEVSRSTVSRRVRALVEKGILGPDVIPGYQTKSEIVYQDQRTVNAVH